MTRCPRPGVAVAALLLLAAPAIAQPAPTLRWGGDKGGGAPYIYEGPDGKLTGFEVELAEYLAGRLGVPSRFVQKDWAMLPQDLARGDLD
ncbi:MAG TPA: transporter substrate-binding domain-containing protein, partial [Gemmataceae bacterium]|nr:transporter substrate-binding domain-containing protein [Gemmataceae bacterium]